MGGGGERAGEAAYGALGSLLLPRAPGVAKRGRSAWMDGGAPRAHAHARACSGPQRHLAVDACDDDVGARVLAAGTEEYERNMAKCREHLSVSNCP